MKYDQAWGYVTDGKYLKAARAVYDAAMDYWWILAVYMFGLIIIYVATDRNPAITTAVNILAVVVLTWAEILPTVTHGVIFLAAAMTMSMAIFKFMGKEQ